MQVSEFQHQQLMFSRLYWRKVKSLSKVCIIKVNSDPVHKLRMPNFASTQASDLKVNDPGVRIEQGPPQMASRSQTVRTEEGARPEWRKLCHMGSQIPRWFSMTHVFCIYTLGESLSHCTGFIFYVQVVKGCSFYTGHPPLSLCSFSLLDICSRGSQAVGSTLERPLWGGTDAFC